MSLPAIATATTVAAAVEALLAEGVYPSLLAIRAQIGGGSLTTIHHHRRLPAADLAAEVATLRDALARAEAERDREHLRALRALRALADLAGQGRDRAQCGGGAVG